MPVRDNRKRVRRRKAVWKRDSKNGFAPCCWCSKPLAYEQFTLEHIVPTVEMGTDELVNLKVSCYKCNTDRGIIIGAGKTPPTSGEGRTSAQ